MLRILPPDPMAPPAPVIQAPSSSVTAGENLRVSCSVVGEQDVAVEFTWEYPGQQVSHSGRGGLRAKLYVFNN